MNRKSASNESIWKKNWITDKKSVALSSCVYRNHTHECNNETARVGVFFAPAPVRGLARIFGSAAIIVVAATSASAGRDDVQGPPRAIQGHQGLRGPVRRREQTGLVAERQNLGHVDA